ncbi:uncharacterized protein L969DRAFT_43313 [Mixia osmundae IAM 14324]|uniref:Uncharacterized protein n=1 Tax=Mixia osmundae (strain CBS 9802 / IAM 14324 / JCM 22182 / KY 12970) TaxID=764103 RepID=G7E3V3_MIXOS|nr:uncharacterized protein L969DRAFT_43313 [Mixia osmundae IAM 14324]KEI41958.1 hypothetical protein L969DRAFT_43313 [Mixia osmundae IAM 14324]GAA97513.1 hypothetical protein E5Q_04191 [Mixia osmundae IAM 14324]
MQGSLAELETPNEHVTWAAKPSHLSRSILAGRATSTTPTDALLALIDASPRASLSRRARSDSSVSSASTARLRESTGSVEQSRKRARPSMDRQASPTILLDDATLRNVTNLTRRLDRKGKRTSQKSDLRSQSSLQSSICSLKRARSCSQTPAIEAAPVKSDFSLRAATTSPSALSRLGSLPSIALSRQSSNVKPCEPVSAKEEEDDFDEGDSFELALSQMPLEPPLQAAQTRKDESQIDELLDGLDCNVFAADFSD